MDLNQFYEEFFDHFNSKSPKISVYFDYTNNIINKLREDLINDLKNSEQFKFLSEIIGLNSILKKVVNYMEFTYDSSDKNGITEVVNKHSEFLENYAKQEKVFKNILYIKIILIIFNLILYQLNKHHEYIDIAQNYLQDIFAMVNSNEFDLIFSENKQKQIDNYDGFGLCSLAPNGDIRPKNNNIERERVTITEQEANEVSKFMDDLRKSQPVNKYYIIIDVFLLVLSYAGKIKSHNINQLLEKYIDYVIDHQIYCLLAIIYENKTKLDEKIKNKIITKFNNYLGYLEQINNNALFYDGGISRYRESFPKLISFAKFFNSQENDLLNKTYRSIKNILTNFDKPISPLEIYNKQFHQIELYQRSLNDYYIENIDCLRKLNLPNNILSSEENKQLLLKKKHFMPKLDNISNRPISNILSDNKELKIFLSKDLFAVDFNNLEDYPKYIVDEGSTLLRRTHNNSLIEFKDKKVQDYYNIISRKISCRLHKYLDTISCKYTYYTKITYIFSPKNYFKFKCNTTILQYTLSECKQLIENNSIIPYFYYKNNPSGEMLLSKKISIFAKILYYGLKLDSDIVVHMLCPNVEDLLRTIIENKTTSSTAVIKTGDEKASVIDKLDIFAKKILDENLIFEIQYLFSKGKEGGFNLRHNIAHGIFDADHNLVIIYAWYRIMKFIFIDGLALINESSKNCRK